MSEQRCGRCPPVHKTHVRHPNWLIIDAREESTYRCEVRREEDLVLCFFVKVSEGVKLLEFDNVFADDEGLFFRVRVGMLSVRFTELGFIHVCMESDVSGGLA